MTVRMRSGFVLLLLVALVLAAFAPLAFAAAPAQEEEAVEPKYTGVKPEDVQVAIVAGGPHPYFGPMEPGAADAQAAFGLGKVEYKVPQDWNLNTSNQLLSSLAAQGFNAFGSWPADANASNATFDELVEQGFPVISVAACINEPTSASFCLSTDVAESAYIATKTLIAALGGKGKIVHGTGYLKDLNSQKRMAAVEKAVAEAGGDVELIQVLADIDDQEAADRAFSSLFAARADEIDGIVTTAYVPSVVAATHLRNIGDKRIKMVGIDDDPIVLDAIRDGYLVGTMSQNPYGQAYISAKVLADLKMGCVPKADAPFHIDSGTLLISQENIDTYDEERKALTREITAKFRGAYLDCPAEVYEIFPDPTPEPAVVPEYTGVKPEDVQVAIVAGGPHPYFGPMEPGAADAQAAFGLGKVEYKVPQDWNLNTSNQLLSSLAAQGFNAFGSWPADANASNATFDELVEQGFPVISVAACINEPTSASFCLSTDVAESAYIATKTLIAALGGKGKIVHGTGYLKDLNSQKRMAAVEKAVAEAGGDVELIQVLADIDDQEAADRAFSSLFAARADEIDGIVTTAYVPSVVAATHLRNIGDKRIKMVGIDDDPIVLDAIRDGYLVGTMSQNPYGQAYISAKVLADLKMGCVPKADAPFHIDSGTLLISQENIDTYDEERKALTREITAKFRGAYLDCPAEVYEIFPDPEVEAAE